MRIISVKKGFTSDHSSTSYEFLAVDKALGKQERAKVASLSSRATPTSRRVSFIYHVDGYDIPGGWGTLMEKYYDVMYREDYDWWTLSIAFNTTEEQIAELGNYDFSGVEDLGVSIDRAGNRAIVSIYCRIDWSYLVGNHDEYDEHDEHDEEVDENGEAGFIAEDGLLNLLVQVRHQIIKRDYRALYAVWEKYGYKDDGDFEIPVPEDKKPGKNIVNEFSRLLESY
ncbi:MAG: hypothetical protein GX783_11555 [Clostridiales bacterium]|nr:hypothetical protein [Clostridiales bacterium]